MPFPCAPQHREPRAMSTKPQLSFWQIWNMCFGFLGIQFGFALQNANVSRIFETLGAKVDDDSHAVDRRAPAPACSCSRSIGYLCDRTWTRSGRRRTVLPDRRGARLARRCSCMPNSPTLWFAAGMLWVLDAVDQHHDGTVPRLRRRPAARRAAPTGYAMQSFFIGVGSVVASLLPLHADECGPPTRLRPGHRARHRALCVLPRRRRAAARGARLDGAAARGSIRPRSWRPRRAWHTPRATAAAPRSPASTRATVCAVAAASAGSRRR